MGEAAVETAAEVAAGAEDAAEEEEAGVAAFAVFFALPVADTAAATGGADDVCGEVNSLDDGRSKGLKMPVAAADAAAGKDEAPNENDGTACADENAAAVIALASSSFAPPTFRAGLACLSTPVLNPANALSSVNAPLDAEAPAEDGAALKGWKSKGGRAAGTVGGASMVKAGASVVLMLAA